MGRFLVAAGARRRPSRPVPGTPLTEATATRGTAGCAACSRPRARERRGMCWSGGARRLPAGRRAPQRCGAVAWRRHGRTRFATGVQHGAQPHVERPATSPPASPSRRKSLIASRKERGLTARGKASPTHLGPRETRDFASPQRTSRTPAGLERQHTSRTSTLPLAPSVAPCSSTARRPGVGPSTPTGAGADRRSELLR